MHRIFYHSLIFAMILVFGTSMTLFNLYHFPKTTGATCMDGSQYGIYLFTPDADTTSNKLLIYFEEIWQGWCAKDSLNDSLAHCYKYISDSNFIEYGSSNNWGDSFTVLNGILSSNSVFGAWPKVIIKSCDGGSYFSDTNTTYKNKVMKFKGTKNVIESINYLNKNNLLQNREEVVLVGVGNGGLAALAWADTIKSNTRGKVKVIVDAGVWENQLNQKTKNASFESRIKQLDKLFLNGRSFPNSKCQAANQQNIEKCFYASQLTKFVDPSIQIMFLESYYDTWAAAQILGLSCSQEFGSLSECTTEHKQTIQDYHKKVQGFLIELGKLPNVSVFGIACVAHFFTNGRWDNTDFSVPMSSNNTAEFVIGKWISSKSSADTLSYLDTVEWPNNKPCARQVKTSNLISQ